MTRVAVCDLGTNSTRLLVADVAGASIVELDRRLTITRLGEGVDRAGVLLPAAMHRVLVCVSGYARAARSYGVERCLAYATSAVRDAANGATFLGGVEARTGFPTRLLTGSEEAVLTFNGACAGHASAGRILVVDLGGGSTEIAVGAGGEVEFHASLEIGCVRLAERFLHGDPPTAAEQEALRQSVRTAIAREVPARFELELGIGVAGTATTLATLHLGLDEEDPRLVHGHAIPAGWIEEEARRLASTPVAALAERAGVHPGRAPVIAAGALALATILEHVGLDELELSENDVLHGAAAELAAGRL